MPPATTATAYDAIPYQSKPFRETRPERLAAVARLFGLDAPSAERCRVLEIGCSMGGNLIPMAQDLPGSTFLGIDASSRQISEGWRTIEALGLRNVQLRHLDIMEVEKDLGEFDYIVSHGVFSWVPPRVQNRMLELCQRHLAPRGVAYISYNTYPGWHIRGIVRDMMLYRGMQFADPATRLAQAKSLVGFVAQATRGSDTPYQRLLQGELKHISQMEDYYLHHDHLEEHNEPVYFHEFARRLGVNGLQYLGEADFSMMVPGNFSAEVASTLNELGAHDIVQMEQYMDFVRCRYFRKTLICRSGLRLNRMIAPDVVKGLLLSCNVKASGEPVPLAPDATVTFTTPGGESITCKSPLTKIALQALAERWPLPMAFEELLTLSKAQAARAGHPADAASAEGFLAAEMLTCMAAGLAEWRLTPVAFTTEVEARPATTPLARLEAERGYRATSMRGESVSLDELHRQALRLLDGSRSLEQIADALTDMFRRGELVLHREENQARVESEREARALLRPALDKALKNLARKALLRRTAR